MDDVIFAGTAKRPALGRAEVGLTIDNSAGLLPIEFTEVTITRTLFRTGDSEYAINGVPCRLLDIQELLSDTGVGRQQHVIVSQGQLDAVLNARPEDRRAIIEEAAGVLKFRTRKEKAERRLDATEGNLLRLQDLLREVRRQLRPLERQADAARRHGALVAELTALRLFLAGREIAVAAARSNRSPSTGSSAAERGARAASRRWPGSTPRSWRPRPSCRPRRAPTSATSWCASSSCASGHGASRRCSPSAGARSSATAASCRRRRRRHPRGRRGAPARRARRGRRRARDLVAPRPRRWRRRTSVRHRARAFRASRCLASRRRRRRGGDRGAEVRGELRSLRSAVERSESELRRVTTSGDACAAASTSSPPRPTGCARDCAERRGGGDRARRRGRAGARRRGTRAEVALERATRARHDAVGGGISRRRPRRGARAGARRGPRPRRRRAARRRRRRGRHAARPGRDRRRLGAGRRGRARRGAHGGRGRRRCLGAPGARRAARRRHQRRRARARDVGGRCAATRRRSARAGPRPRPGRPPGVVSACSTRCSAAPCASTVSGRASTLRSPIRLVGDRDAGR